MSRSKLPKHSTCFLFLFFFSGALVPGSEMAVTATQTQPMQNHGAPERVPNDSDHGPGAPPRVFGLRGPESELFGAAGNRRFTDVRSRCWWNTSKSLQMGGRVPGGVAPFGRSEDDRSFAKQRTFRRKGSATKMAFRIVDWTAVDLDHQGIR